MADVVNTEDQSSTSLECLQFTRLGQRCSLLWESPKKTQPRP